MANLKITELSSYTTPIATDVLPIVDITTTTTKKIAWSNIKTTLGTPTSGSGAPATTPTTLGTLYIDSVNKNAYIAVGTSSSSDWKIISII
jgi:hypothetical protein